MDAKDYEELNANQMLLDFHEINYSFMISKNITHFILLDPNFVTTNLHELSKEVLKRTETKEIK